MDGNVIMVCTVTVAKKFEMVQREQGKEFARGRVVWSRKCRSEKGVEKTPEFREVVAFQGAARALCHLEKGDPVQFLARQQSQRREVEKDGVKTVYNDVVFTVYGDVTFLPQGNKAANKDPAAAKPEQTAPAAQAESSAVEQETHDDDDFLASSMAASIVSALPF